LSDSVALVTVEDIARAYDFGTSHPLRPERVLLTYDKVRDLGLIDRDNVREVPSRSADDEEILAVHESDFVEMVRAIDAGRVDEHAGLEYGLGTPDDPIFEGIRGRVWGLHRGCRAGG
jgi:acetoin utilization protein AcuC